MKLTQLTQPQIQGIPVSQLPPHCHVAVVNLPAPEYGQPCLPVVQHPPLANQPDYQATDRLVVAIEEVFFDRAFATVPGVVCSTTVNVTQFEDGRIGFGMLQAYPDELKTMGYTLNHGEVDYSAENFALCAHNAFLQMAQYAQVNQLHGLTVDKSYLNNF